MQSHCRCSDCCFVTFCPHTFTRSLSQRSNPNLICCVNWPLKWQLCEQEEEEEEEEVEEEEAESLLAH